MTGFQLCHFLRKQSQRILRTNNKHHYISTLQTRDLQVGVKESNLMSPSLNFTSLQKLHFEMKYYTFLSPFQFPNPEIDEAHILIMVDTNNKIID